jgi:hypothetical protein
LGKQIHNNSKINPPKATGNNPRKPPQRPDNFRDQLSTDLFGNNENNTDSIFDKPKDINDIKKDINDDTKDIKEKPKPKIPPRAVIEETQNEKVNISFSEDNCQSVALSENKSSHNK